MFDKSDLICVYTRADAIEDGALVDVTETAREAGFVCSVAMTHAVWVDCVEWSTDTTRRKTTLQDEDGRLWDVIWMAWVAIRAAGRGCGQRLAFQVYRVPARGRGVCPRPVALELHIGGGDAGEPVITIMQPHED